MTPTRAAVREAMEAFEAVMQTPACRASISVLDLAQHKDTFRALLSSALQEPEPINLGPLPGAQEAGTLPDVRLKVLNYRNSLNRELYNTADIGKNALLRQTLQEAIVFCEEVLSCTPAAAQDVEALKLDENEIVDPPSIAYAQTYCSGWNDCIDEIAALLQGEKK